MRILVTNDDGIEAEGLWALAQAMSELGPTLIVAPEHTQSGVGTSVTLRRAMNICEVESRVPGVRAYSVDGTPGDCVILGLRRVAKERITLLVSGVNAGANVGNEILVSGTVGATWQGYFRGLNSMAVSLDLQRHPGAPLYTEAARVAKALVQRLSDRIPSGFLLNMNVPNIRLENIAGVALTRVARGAYFKLDDVGEGSARSYQSTLRTDLAPPEHTDMWALVNDMVSITPLEGDLSDHALIQALHPTADELLRDLRGAPA